MPSISGRGPEAHRRRTLVLAAAIVVAAAVVVLGVLPVARRWRDREALIAASRERLSRVESIVGREAELRELARELDALLDAGGRRLVRARTVPLAASALQSMVREYASASGLSVTRMDAAGLPEGAGSTPLALPATVSAQGDIYGVADFLRRIQHGTWIVEVTDIAITPNPVLRGNILQLTLGLRAPIALEP